MNRMLPLLGLLLPTFASAGDIALVTLSSGEVRAGDAASPAAPFVLEPGKPLTLAEGASVVVLFDGNASRFRGPRDLSLDDLSVDQAKRANASALAAVLSRDVSFAKAGASRGGEVQLTRPLPGGTVVAPQDIRWSCDACGEQSVEIYAFLEDKTVWTGKGDGMASYAGPPLAAGPYLVRIGSREFSFTVADQATRERVNLARAAADTASEDLKSQGVADAAALVSIPAGVYLRSGLPSEALWLIDDAIAEHPKDAALQELRASYERQAGLAQP